jgi:cell division septation protein DedD
VVLLLALVAWAATGGGAARAPEGLRGGRRGAEQVRAALDRGDIARALSLLDAHGLADSGDPEWLWLQACATTSPSRLRRLLRALAESAVSPGQAERALWARAGIDYLLGRYEAAAAGFQLYLARFPQGRRYYQAALLMAAARLAAGQPRLAEATLSRLLLDGIPDAYVAQAAILLGDAYTRLGNDDLAAVQYRTAAGRPGPYRAEALERLGERADEPLPFGWFIPPGPTAAPGPAEGEVSGEPDSGLGEAVRAPRRATPTPAVHSSPTPPAPTPTPLRPAASATPPRGHPAETAKPARVFYVQVASTTRSQGARELRRRLERAGYSVRVVTASSRRGRRYRIWVGPYATRERADAAREELRSRLRMNGYVLQADPPQEEEP